MSEGGGLSSVLGGDQGAVEALRKMWGERDYRRRTRGSPERTRVLAVLHAVSKDLEHRFPERCHLPEIEALAEVLSHTWAGEGGWDTMAMVEGVKAATAETHVHASSENGKRE